MFCFVSDFEVVNYADDSITFIDKVVGISFVEELEVSSSILFTWLIQGKYRQKPFFVIWQ